LKVFGAAKVDFGGVMNIVSSSIVIINNIRHFLKVSYIS
jgi:hypothetical protein